MNIGIGVLLGKTISSILDSSDEIIFTISEDEKYKMYHDQDCCESVCVEDITGDLRDLINSPITMAEEISNAESPEGFNGEHYDSYTWTFYKLGYC